LTLQVFIVALQESILFLEIFDLSVSFPLVSSIRKLTSLFITSSDLGESYLLGGFGPLSSIARSLLRTSSGSPMVYYVCRVSYKSRVL